MNTRANAAHGHSAVVRASGYEHVDSTHDTHTRTTAHVAVAAADSDTRVHTSVTASAPRCRVAAAVECERLSRAHERRTRTTAPTPRARADCLPIANASATDVAARCAVARARRCEHVNRPAPTALAPASRVEIAGRAARGREKSWNRSCSASREPVRFFARGFRHRGIPL